MPCVMPQVPRGGVTGLPAMDFGARAARVPRAESRSRTGPLRPLGVKAMARIPERCRPGAQARRPLGQSRRDA